MTDHDYTTASLRDGETTDEQSHAQRNLEQITQLKAELEDNE